LFGNLVGELLPAYKLEDAEGDGGDSQPNGHLRAPSDASKYSSQVVASPLFPEVEKLLSLFKDSCKELLELRKQVFLPLSISSFYLFFIFLFFEVLIYCCCVLVGRLMGDSTILRKMSQFKTLSIERHFLR